MFFICNKLCLIFIYKLIKYLKIDIVFVWIILLIKMLKFDRIFVKFKVYVYVVVSVIGFLVEVDYVYFNELSNDGWFKGL